jgi:hypothetical protein
MAVFPYALRMNSGADPSPGVFLLEAIGMAAIL